MAHRTSLEIQSLLRRAADLALEAERHLLAAPGARHAQHLTRADYREAEVYAQGAVDELRRAMSLMAEADRVAFVHPDGAPAVRCAEGWAFNRRGEKVRVSIPESNS